eukprot:g11455.t1
MPAPKAKAKVKGAGRSHVKKVAEALAHHELEFEIESMRHDAEKLAKVRAASSEGAEGKRTKIEFQIKNSTDPVSRMLKLKENLSNEAVRARDGVPEPPAEAPPEEAPEPPPPPEETPEDGGAGSGAILMVVHVDMHKQHEIDQSSRFTRCDHRVCGGGQATTQWLPGEHEKAAWAWLKGLDGGRGSLLRYFPVMRDEFDCDFAQLAAARLEKPLSPGALGHLEPSFFEALGVTSAGHRLLLAKGILGLDQPL